MPDEPYLVFDRLDKVKLDTTYMTQAYKGAMLRYSAQLGGLVTAHARNHGKRCKHVDQGICAMCVKHGELFTAA
jgi:hypothetical protein